MAGTGAARAETMAGVVIMARAMVAAGARVEAAMVAEVVGAGVSPT